MLKLVQKNKRLAIVNCSRNQISAIVMEKIKRQVSKNMQRKTGFLSGAGGRGGGGAEQHDMDLADHLYAQAMRAASVEVDEFADVDWLCDMPEDGEDVSYSFGDGSGAVCE